MHADRFLKIVLTIIAVELFWIAVKDVATPVAAQVQPAPTPVIIRGVDMADGLVPIAIGAVRQPVPIDAVRSIRIQADRPLTIQATEPLKVEFDQPVRVENVPYTPSPRPGE
jgi:hypothetical protein